MPVVTKLRAVYQETAAVVPCLGPLDFPTSTQLCVLQYGVKKKFTPTEEVKETPMEEEKEDE